MQQETKDHINDHTAKVTRLLENNLSSVNAYLNNMHVKADVVRIDLDALRRELPVVSSRLDETIEELRSKSATFHERDEALESSINRLFERVTHIRDHSNER